jgi:5'-deoxynucleotidase YfbR-like HD superfamily hydrolase
MLKFYDEEGNLKDLIFAEFKKYSDINNYKYKKYNSMKVLSESFEEMMKLMLIDTKEEINTIFNQYINKKITRTELATKLDKYVSNSSDDEDTETMMLDISKISKNLCSQYAYPGIPVKHTKFAKLEKSMVKDIVSFKTPEKFKEDVNHMLKVSRQIQFIQDLDEEQRVRDLTWYGAKDKANEYAEIIDDKVFSDGMAGDVLIFVGLSDAILACNYSQKVREGLIDGHPVNNLELVKSAYGNTYDHYNIPLSWFTTLKLPEVKKAKTKKKSVEI